MVRFLVEEKPKIKLSELTDLYDIEDDSATKKEVVKEVAKEEDDEPTFEETVEYYDKKIEEEFDNGI